MPITAQDVLKSPATPHLRATSSGCVYWNCPKCGYPNRTRDRYDSAIFQCRNVECRKMWKHGHAFWAIPRGGRERLRALAPDQVLHGVMSTRNGYVNVVIDDDAQGETPDATDATGPDAP